MRPSTVGTRSTDLHHASLRLEAERFANELTAEVGDFWGHPGWRVHGDGRAVVIAPRTPGRTAVHYRLELERRAVTVCTLVTNADGRGEWRKTVPLSAQATPHEVRTAVRAALTDERGRVHPSGWAN